MGTDLWQARHKRSQKPPVMMPENKRKALNGFGSGSTFLEFSLGFLGNFELGMINNCCCHQLMDLLIGSCQSADIIVNFPRFHIILAMFQICCGSSYLYCLFERKKIENKEYLLEMMLSCYGLLFG